MNAFKFRVATLYNRVHMRDELEIRVKNDAQISVGCCVQDGIAKDSEGRCHLLPMSNNLVCYQDLTSTCFCTYSLLTLPYIMVSRSSLLSSFEDFG